MAARRRLRIPADVAAGIRGLHPELKRKVRAALEDILENPDLGKALRDELDGSLSCRVLRFRTISPTRGSRPRPRQSDYEHEHRFAEHEHEHDRNTPPPSCSCACS